MHADVPTMAMMSSVACLSSAASLLWFARGDGVEGLESWAWGLLSFAGALAALAAFGLVPDAMSVVTGNVMLAGTMSMMRAAVCRLQRTAPPLPMLAAPVLVVATVSVAQLALPLPGSGVVSAVIGLQGFEVALLAYRRRRLTPGRGYQLIVAGAALAGAVPFGRLISSAAGWADGDALGVPGAAFPLGFAGMLAAVLLCSFGFLGMTKERSDERNRRLAMRDTLTGLANRRALLRDFDQRRASALRRQAPLTVLMIDIDHFKSVNDRHGHAAGDEVLKQVARAVRARIRTQDSVGRYGGEEFMVLLPDTPEAGGRRVAQDLCDLIRTLRVEAGPATVGVTLSIGVHCGPRDADESLDDMIRAADEALYRAKQGGRDRVESAVPDTQPALAGA